ncbi:acetolactate synthase AlsS [Synechococcus sp. CB0101]|uniref:acetolactate synthase AlsS n=1 Tax=Synechococcus sp. CB0101 TaxID=232348 RepID=UPI0002002AA0|nr:acetolactate synthase AlsS [Synechococcus sp. CB0101]QCH13599.1 acetolactate synthase AlsS [Synechococcus sp. CB0101]
MNGAQVLVKLLEQHGVTHVFGIPGAKVDSVFEALSESSIELVLCRHEQNAAFMAQAVGRMTGTVGVCLVTSGPGVTNLVTGLATANSEGDPVLAIGGEVPIDDRFKHTHQALDGVDVMRPVTKYAQTALSIHSLPEVFGNAVRAAESGRPGAAFLGLPKDVGLAEFPGELSAGWARPVHQGAAAASELSRAADLINASRRPLLLLGMQASQGRLAESLQAFVRGSGLPYCATFQGPGAWVAPDQFAGRVGLFRNQPADHLLDAADCVITVGFDAIEFDPSLWNTGNSRPLVVVDVLPPDQDQAFLPSAELIGGIDASLSALAPLIKATVEEAFRSSGDTAAAELHATAAEGAQLGGTPLHPLRVIHELRQVVTPDTTLALDVGSHYIWMNRYFPAGHARQVLVSNGQQTLGVALPWAMATNLCRPGQPVISVSGDGGFLFTATELQTATRIGSRFVHLIWNSGSYDMVAFQEQAHYGRTAGVELGTYNVEAFAEAFGCKGYRITAADQLGPVLREALQQTVPVLIDIPIDYSQNLKLMQNVHQDFIH